MSRHSAPEKDMPSLEISFDVKDPNRIELPNHLLRSGGNYLVEVRDGDIYVWGNADGLRYLAEAFARLAVGGYARTLHVHLPADSRLIGQPINAQESPQLVLFAASEVPA